jgi:hypothetical protein
MQPPDVYEPLWSKGVDMFNGKLGGPCRPPIPPQGYDTDPRVVDSKMWRSLWDAWDGDNYKSKELFLRGISPGQMKLLSFFPMMSFSDAVQKFDLRQHGDTIVTDEWNFGTATIQPKGIRNPGRLNTTQRQSHSQALTHYGNGFQTSLDFLNDKKKEREYLMFIKQVQQNVLLTWAKQLVSVMTRQAKNTREAVETTMTYNNVELDRFFAETWARMFSIQKSGGSMKHIEGVAMSQGELRNVQFDSVLLPSSVNHYLNFQTEHRGNRHTSSKHPEQPVTPVYHMQMYWSRDFQNEGNLAADDPLTETIPVSQYFYMGPLTRETNEDYSSMYRTINIVDAQRTRDADISLRKAFEHAGLFSMPSKTKPINRGRAIGYSAVDNQSSARSRRARPYSNNTSRGAATDRCVVENTHTNDERTLTILGLNLLRRLYGQGDAAKCKFTAYEIFDRAGLLEVVINLLSSDTPKANNRLLSLYNAIERQTAGSGQITESVHLQAANPHVAAPVYLNPGLPTNARVGRHVTKIVIEEPTILQWTKQWLTSTAGKHAHTAVNNGNTARSGSNLAFTAEGSDKTEFIYMPFVKKDSGGLVNVLLIEEDGEQLTMDNCTRLKTGQVLQLFVYAVWLLINKSITVNQVLNTIQVAAPELIASSDTLRKVVEKIPKFNKVVALVATQLEIAGVITPEEAGGVLHTLEVDRNYIKTMTGSYIYAATRQPADTTDVSALDAVGMLLGDNRPLYIPSTSNVYTSLVDGVLNPLAILALDARINIDQGFLQRRDKIRAIVSTVFVRPDLLNQDISLAEDHTANTLASLTEFNRTLITLFRHGSSPEKHLQNQLMLKFLETHTLSALGVPGTEQFKQPVDVVADSNRSAPGAMMARRQKAIQLLETLDATRWYFWDALLVGNIPFPMSFLLFRMHMMVKVGSCIFFVRGEATGVLVTKDASVIFHRDVNSFALTVQVQFKSSTLILNRRNLEMVPYTFGKQYIRGGGVKLYNASNKEHQQNWQNGQCDIFVTAIGYDEYQPRSYIDITGHLAHNIQPGMSPDEHYSTGTLYKTHFKWEANIYATRTSRVAPGMTSTVVSVAAQASYKRYNPVTQQCTDIVPGSGPMGYAPTPQDYIIAFGGHQSGYNGIRGSEMEGSRHVMPVAMQ